MTKRLLQTIAKEVAVTNYVDYREYLQAVYDVAKGRQSPYSYLLFAEDLGFSPTNVIRLVIANQRQLADKSAQTVVKSLDLRKDDRKYFLAMVKHANSRGADRRVKHFQKMVEVKQATVSEDSDRKRMRYFSEWYYPVVRELSRLDAFQDDPAWMAARLYPHVTADKVREAITLLTSLGLYVHDAPMVMPADAAAEHLSLTQYHQAMLDVTKEAVTRVPPSHREMNALTLSMSAETFAQLKAKIRDFCADAMASEARAQPRECVAQLNVQLFTLTKPDDGSES